MKLIEDFNAVPSLGLLTGIQVVVAIWNRNDIICSISKCLNQIDVKAVDRNWGEITRRVKVIVRSIEDIPSDLLIDMDAIVFSVGCHIREIKTFISFSPYFDYANYRFPVNHWTPYGTVDTKKVNEQLAHDDRRCIYYRYNLACNNCFERIIVELFPALFYLYKNVRNIHLGRELISYWTCRLSKDLLSLNEISYDEENGQHYSAQQVAFLFTLRNCNKSGVEYFLNYLSSNEYEYVLDNKVSTIVKGSFAYRIGPNYYLPPSTEQHTDTIYFLLSKLENDQRMKILRKNSFQILSSFLQYPFFGLFSKYSNILVPDLKWNEIRLLLHRIFYLEERNTHFFGLELFDDLWCRCPQKLKLYVKWIEMQSISCESEEFLPMLERIRKVAKNS